MATHQSPIKIWDDAKTMRLVVAFLGEFVGTCLLVFVACGFVFVSDNFPRSSENFLATITMRNNEEKLIAPALGSSSGNETQQQQQEQFLTLRQPEMVIFTDNLLRNSMAIGAVLSGVVLVTNPVTGGHINPAVTFAFLLLGKISLFRTIGYVISQCLGSIMASAILYAIFSLAPGGKEPFGCTSPASFVADFPAIVVEAAATFVLVFTILAICQIIERSGKPSNRPPILLIIALFAAITITVYIAAPFTGGSLNPARSFGPAIVWGCWKRHHVYWLGPLTGSVFAAVIFYLFTLQIDEIDAETAEKNKAKQTSGNTSEDETSPLLEEESMP